LFFLWWLLCLSILPSFISSKTWSRNEVSITRVLKLKFFALLSKSWDLFVLILERH
jgi:hypothetical protein